MLRKTFSGLILIVLLTGILTSTLDIQPVKASGTIYIRSDGGIDPPDAPITTLDNVTYTLTDNITSSDYGVVVERDNIIVDGAGYTLKGTLGYPFKGVDLTGRTNVTIENTNIKNFDYGVSLYYSSNNNSITGNNITNNNYGVSLYYSSNNSISGNTFINNGLQVLDSYGNVVEDNTVNGKPLVYLEGVQNYSVSDAGQVILVNCNNITVENLNLSNTDTGVQLGNANNCSITGNNITNNGDGIRLSSSSNNTIFGNNITANNGWGIYLLHSSNNNSITGNNITNNNCGVDLCFSSSNTVYGNNITNNNYDGVYLTGSSNNTVSGNNITNNNWDGVYLTGSSNNTVSGNNITNNSWYGISLVDSSNNNIVSGNNITNNGYGVFLYYSSNNRFYHNNFINNTYQVGLTDSFNNTWDNGCEGNYWSNYNGTDLDGDGIGDTFLPWEAVDNYPLMNPYWLPGDVNHDLKINIYDVVRITAIYGSEQGDLNWNPHSDIAEPYGIIDIYDVVTCTKDYGKEYTP